MFGQSKRALLFIDLPLIGFLYFGILAAAAHYSAHVYNWRTTAISKLLYPAYDPAFHLVASLGVALAGLLILPFVAYIRRKLTRASGVAAGVGALALAAGAIGLALAGLIVCHPAQGTAAFPKLHEILARTAAVALGIGMVVLCGCAARECSVAPANDREWHRLVIAWTLITLPLLLVVILGAAAAAHLHWSNPIYQLLRSRDLWRLGFWEWLGSAAVYLFLASAALFLPDPD